MERLRISRKALAYVLGLLTFLQLNQQAVAALTVARLIEPYRKIRGAISQPGITGAVFLHDSPGFVAKHFNINESDWPHATRVFLLDADPEHRNDWACRFHASTWTMVEYDPIAHTALLTSAPTNCGDVEK